jgi:hypothetical protein
MAPIRNAAVAAGLIDPSTNSTIYTVPGGNAFIWKNAFLHNNGATTPTVNVWVASASASISMPVASTTLGAGGMFSWSGWTVLNAGDSIIMTGNAGSVHYWIAGAVLPHA